MIYAKKIGAEITLYPFFLRSYFAKIANWGDSF
jgi:hypothetical protein